jgi:hypothetical protein
VGVTHAAMTLRLGHAQENPLLNKLSEGQIQMIKDFECSMSLVHDTHRPEH